MFSGLDFGRAFRLDDEAFGPDHGGNDDRDEPTLPLPEVAGDTDAGDPLPKRDRPFTQPVHDRNIDNEPDLEASEQDGRLSIYYPDHEDATITSDTWQRIER